MKIIVVGAAGIQSLAALLYLLDQEDVSQIVAADIREDIVKERIAKLGDERLVPAFVDITDINGTARVFKGNDVVINCAYQGYVTDSEYINYEYLAAKAAMEAGVNYICVGGAPPALEELALDEEFRRKGILSIPGMGIAPGGMQVMAAYAINKLDITDSVDMLVLRKDLIPAEEHSHPLHLLMGLGGSRFIYCSPSTSYENGKIKIHEPRANVETIEIPEPFGTMTVASTPGAPLISLSRSFPDIKRINFKTTLDTKMNFFRDLGLFRNDLINLQGHMVSPWEVLMTLIKQLPPETQKAPDIYQERKVIVRGVKNGRNVEYIIIAKPHSSPRFIYMSGLSGTLITGTCIAIAAVMVGRGQAKGKGVLMPEVCLPPEQFLDELSKAWVEVEILREETL